MDVGLFRLTVLLYSLATVGYLAYLIWMKRALGGISRGVLFAGFLVQTASIVMRYAQTGYLPVTNRFEALAFFSWVLAGVFLLVQIRHALHILGAFVTPPSLLLLLLASLDDPNVLLSKRLAGFLPSHWLPMHVWFAFLGNALLGISACLAGMYLIQERQLKKTSMGPWYYRLPPLDLVDRLSYRCISIGFPFLTLGILTGSIWLKSAQGAYIDWQDGRQTATLLTWFLYAGLLHGRLIAGWRGRKVAWLNIVGFLVILGTFLKLSHFMK